ncbi:MAG: carbohydrate ABC transporter permease [Clostridia bacterium]|nr:carbohydrate ABC transporter permease [Clostridia bacterium]
MNSKKVSKAEQPLSLMIPIYVVCILLAVLSIAPFWIMIINATRSTTQIQAHAISFIPGNALMNNLEKIQDKDMFKPLVGFANSALISVGVTVLALYFSSLTAYALTAYEWKLRESFFSMIMGVMMIPSTVTTIGFYQACYRLGLDNNRLMLILPAIASPMMVFFMRQYLQASLQISIVESARIDGAKELQIFNKIILPIMKPALATQAIFTFVSSWNNFFMPLVLLTKSEKYTMPIMVRLLNGDSYKTEYGCVYLGLSMTVLPLILVYMFLSKYIVAGVALGGVKG